jgi:hypothetical protein
MSAPNPGVNRSAKQLRCLVPATLRALAPPVTPIVTYIVIT